MKKYILLFLTLAFYVHSFAQGEVITYFSEARAAYHARDLEDARFKLQQSLEALDALIATEILKILPETMSTLHTTGDDEYTGNVTGFTGLYVNRTYANSSNQEQTAEINILNDSPLLAGVTSFLSLPVIGGLTGQGKKSIKIDGYKGMMQREENSTGTPTYTVSIPFGQSLLTFTTHGIEDENAVLQMANTIPMRKIADIAQ